jgi:hypothetical protein
MMRYHRLIEKFESLQTLITGPHQHIQTTVPLHTSPYLRAQLINPAADELTLYTLTNPIYLAG